MRSITQLTPRVRTPLRIDAMLDMGAAGYYDAFGKTPKTYVLAMAASQWTAEHGIEPGTERNIDGAKVIWSLWNNNWGNVTCYSDSDCPKFQLTTKERMVRVGDVQKDGTMATEDVWKTKMLYYVSYPTPRHGAGGYWAKMRDRYKNSLNTFETADVNLVAQTLSDERYYTDLVEKYVKNLSYFFPRYVKLLLVGKEELPK